MAVESPSSEARVRVRGHVMRELLLQWSVTFGREADFLRTGIIRWYLNTDSNIHNNHKNNNIKDNKLFSGNLIWPDIELCNLKTFYL